jgi:hypothetical protein
METVNASKTILEGKVESAQLIVNENLKKARFFCDFPARTAAPLENRPRNSTLTLMTAREIP